MKKLLIILTSIQMMSCNTTDSAQGTVNIPFLQKEKPVYDPNAYVNAAFGYSVPVIEALLDVNALNRLYTGMRFYEPQASEAERIGYLQSDADKQKQSNENDRWMGYFRDQMGVNPFN